MVNFPFWIK